MPHQDREDDALIGIKSTALLFGDRTKPMLAKFYGVATVLIGLAGALAGAGALVRSSALLASAAHLAWQIVRLDIGDPDRCLRIFKSNRDAGLILFAGMLLDGLRTEMIASPLARAPAKASGQGGERRWSRMRRAGPNITRQRKHWTETIGLAPSTLKAALANRRRPQKRKVYHQKHIRENKYQTAVYAKFKKARCMILIAPPLSDALVWRRSSTEEKQNCRKHRR